MNRLLDPILGYFAAEPVRVSAFLRLPLIGLIAVLVWIWEVDHWLPVVYGVVLGIYAVAAVTWVIFVIRGPVPRWADWASTGTDVVVIVVLCVVSGGATAALLPVFFLLPISVAFQDRPALTVAEPAGRQARTRRDTRTPSRPRARHGARRPAGDRGRVAVDGDRIASAGARAARPYLSRARAVAAVRVPR